MDNSGLGGGFLSGGGFLDLEPSIHRHQHGQLGRGPQTHPRHIQSPMNILTGLENDHHPIGLTELKGSTQKGFSVNLDKGKSVMPIDGGTNSNNMSEEDEPSFTEDGNCENFNGGKGKKGTPWQRMKWTDNVVRLLITVVSCVGDDGTLEGAEGLKRKSGLLHKKGKWKTVSNIMIGKGCYVSPQQCEDKFNDLNKRYKRLNEILGRGTSCRVVEDPTLMDSMPQLSSKMKDDVKKILSSKHLFYKEMCAYHNGQRIPNCTDFEIQVHSLPLVRCSKDNIGSEDEEAEENGESEDEESENEVDNNERKKGNEEERNFWSQTSGPDVLQAELGEIFQDPKKSQREKREWIKQRILQLQEERVGIQADAFELQKRHFKWKRFCGKKERELERSRLENERMGLENERMALLLKRKELELDFKNSDVSLDPISLNIERLQGRDHIDLGRHP